jgi:hypothetical protein
MAEWRSAESLIEAPGTPARNGVAAPKADIAKTDIAKPDFAKPDIAKAHADFVMALAARKPTPIPREPDPEDFTARAICCEALIERMAAHLAMLIEDAADNDPAGFIRDAELAATIDAHLDDLKGDITGTLEKIAERLRDDRYDGCRPGPFYRRRRL